MYKGIFNDFSHGCLHVCACRRVKQNNIMNEKDFFDLVVKMRTAQKNYFATRTRRGLVPEKVLRDLLFECKIYESKIDHEIERVYEEQREAIEPKLNFESDV